MSSSTLFRPLRRVFALAAVAAILATSTLAQTVTFSNRGCATPEPTASERMQSVFLAEQWLAANAAQVSAFRSSGASVVIPVAFHIISSGPGTSQGNVPDRWITDQMDVLNAAFAPMGYQFTLAFQERVQNAAWSTMSDGTPEEAAMKNTLALDPARFLNIYSVPNLGTLLGWATFPASGAETNKMQGVVLLTGSMPGGSASPYNLGDTGTHEVGHYVGLYHTFQGGCSGTGDGVADTPAVSSANFGCPSIDSCPNDGLGPDMVENFMDYTDDSCMDRFTTGQADRSLGLMNQFRPTMMTQSGAFLSTSALDYGPVPVGSPATRQVQIVNLTSESLTISSIASDASAYVPSISSGTVAAGSSLPFDLTFDPPGAGSVPGTLSVVTTDATIGTLTVSLNGTGVLSPVVASATPALAVSASLGGTASGDLQFQNTGGGVLFYTFDGFARAANPGLRTEADATAVVQQPKGAIDTNRGSAVTMDGGGPDGFGYEWVDSNETGGPTFNWVDISTTGTAVSLGDDATATVALPFAFNFYGADQSNVRIVSNGFLGFGGSSTAYSNASIPSSGVPNNIIAAYWDDLNPAAGGSVRYQNMGDGRFVVSWIGVPRYTGGGSLTFQVILDQAGSIVIQYLNIAPGTGGANSATVGIENADGTDGLQVVRDAPYVENALAIRFSRGAQWISSVTPATGIVAPGGSKTVSVALSAEGLEAGVYQDILTMSTNDPRRESVPFHVVFSVDGALSPPALVAPYFGEAEVNPAADFGWLEVAAATTYDVEIATDDAFTDIVYTGAPSGTTASASLVATTDYFWRARTNTAGGTSDWTIPFPFSTGIVVASENASPSGPEGFSLGTFYPNPTRGTVTIPFSLNDAQTDVSVRVLDVTGRLVADLADSASLAAGTHQLQWQSAAHPAGVYIIQLRANGQVDTGRVVVLR